MFLVRESDGYIFFCEAFIGSVVLVGWSCELKEFSGLILIWWVWWSEVLFDFRGCGLSSLVVRTIQWMGEWPFFSLSAPSSLYILLSCGYALSNIWQPLSVLGLAQQWLDEWVFVAFLSCHIDRLAWLCGQFLVGNSS